MKQWQRGVALGVCLVFTTITSPVFAARRAKAPSVFDEPVSRQIARRAVGQFAADPWLAKEDLPPKIAVGLFEIGFEKTGITARDFTNDMLNAVLEQARVLVVNLDPQFGEEIAFQLTKYEDNRTLRYHAAMLGAAYYLTGSISENEWQFKPGKVKKGYLVDMELRDVHTGQISVALKLPFTASGRLILPKSEKPKVRHKTKVR